MKFITFFMGLVLSFSSFALIYKNHKATLESFEDYERCHQRKFPSAACQEALDNWLKRNPKDIIEAARKTSVLMNARVAVPLFYKAFKLGENSKVSCEDPKLLNSLKSALSSALNEDLLKKSISIIHENCSKSSLPRQTVSSVQVGSKFFQLLCKPYKEVGLLKGVRLKKCQ